MKIMTAADYIGKKFEVVVDRKMCSKHPKHDIYYAVNYGYIPNTKAPDGDEIDAYILGVFEPIDEYFGECIAVIHRLNDDDDKLIIVPEGRIYSDEQIKALTEFQEQYFQIEIIRKSH